MTSPEALARAWPIGAIWSVTPTEGGHNNRSWIIEAEAGKYVLRQYDNLGERAIRFEHTLLTHLGGAALPFAVPVPVESVAGGSLHVAAEERNKPVRAALFPFLPGTHPPGDDPVSAQRLGEALAHLHPALAAAGEALGPSPNTGYANLRHIHPLLPDPLAVARTLDLPTDVCDRWERVAQRALDTAASRYPQLPPQLIHADYGHFNVLVDGGPVTAVLDFEFSCNDIRAMDLASGVRNSSSAAWSESGTFEAAASFMRGYAAVQRPTDGEVEAIPELVHLANVVILTHWAGRTLQGLAERDAIVDFFRRVVDASDVIDARGLELVDTLRRAIES